MKLKYLSLVKDYVIISIACCILGFTMNYFYISNHLAEGGIAGICLILHYLTDLPIGYLYLGINIPLLLLAWKFLGRDFSIKSIYATVLLSYTMDFFAYLREPIPDLLLCSLFGGTLFGLSIGLIFWAGGSTGGTDIIAKMITRYRGIPVGKALLSMDFVILSCVAFLFGKLIFMYTLIAVIVTSKMVDFIQEGFDQAKGVFIVTQKSEEMRQRIDKEIKRGVTFLHGSGGFSGRETNVIYCVINKYQIISLKKLAREVDPEAFITITDVHEVLGNGFKRLMMDE